MDLNDYLVKTFAKAVNNTTEKETKLYYGTITRVETVGDSRIPYVHLDGSDANSETPLVEGTEVMVDDRVIVTIENHKAIVMSNITSPASARTAKNYMDLSEEDEGLVIGALNDENNNYNVLIKSDGVYVRDGDDVLAVYGGDGTYIYADGEPAAEFTAEGIQFFTDLANYAKFDPVTGEFTSQALEYLHADNLDATYASITNLNAATARIGTLEADNATIHGTLTAHEGIFDDLEADNATINGTLTAHAASIGSLEAADATINGTLTAHAASIGTLEADNATINGTLTAHAASIGTLEADNATINGTLTAHAADIESLEADNATINGELTAQSARIGSIESNYVDTDTLEANYAHITDGVIDNATIGYADVDGLYAHYATIDIANVNNGWIENGVIKNAAITNEQVLSVSANKLTAGTIDASEINVANLRAKNLIVEKMNGQPILGGYELVSKNSTGYSGKNPSNEGWYEYQNGSFVASTDTTVNQNKAYYKDGNQVALYDQTYIDGLETNLNQRIDGAVETFTGTAVPTLVNYPAADWTSAQMASHIGDIYYVVNTASNENGYCYRFAYDNTTSSYKWILIKDSDVTKALSDIDDLQDFQSDTESWIIETDEGLETIRSNHTTLSGVVNKTVKSSIQLWFTKANSTAPSAPTSEVTSTSTSGNGWRTVVPTYSSTYPYYFYCWQYKFVDNTFGWSAVIYDQATTEAEERARTGVANAATADGKAVTAQNTANANIKSSVMLWFTKANSTAPSKPTTAVTNNNPTGTNSYNKWNLAVPVYNSSYPYYFYCYQQQKGDGTYQWTDVVYDQATTETQDTARATSSSLANYMTTNDAALQSLKSQVDGQLEIWYGTVAPTTANTPASEWSSTTDKDNHIGDMYYNTTNGNVYQWTKSGSTYSWTEIPESSAAAALAAAQDAQATADGKRRVFTSQPTVPYDIGDLWVNGDEVKYATVKRATGSYTASDWAQTATDDTVANANIKSNVQLWFTKANTTAPSKPTSQVTNSNATGTNSYNKWNLVVPIYNSSYPYYYYCYQQQKGDNTYQWSDVVYDQATSEAMQKAQAALPASTFNTFESTTFKNVKDTVDEQSSTITTLTTAVSNKADSSTVTTLSNTVNSVSQTATSNSSTLSQLTTTLGTNADGTTKADDIMHRMTSQEQDLDGFKTTVSSTYQTKSDMSNYSTTTQMNSAINQKANEITTSVSQTYATQSSIPTKVSDLTNDSNFATQGYADGKASDAQAAAIADANKKLAGHFAVSTTTGSTAAKVATITPAVTGWTLYTGATITVKFTTANTNSAPTLNVNSTGAKTIKAYTGTAALSADEYKWPAGATMSFVYDGTYWRIQDSTELIRLSSAESSITQTANSIVSLVANTDTYTKPDGTTATNTIKSAIKQNAENIDLRVEKSGVIAAINLTSETAKIQASKVEIDGTAVFNAISSDVDSAITGKGYQTASQVSNAISNTSVSELSDGSTYAKKSDALGAVTTKDQYYLSTSSSSATGGSWQDTVPTWSANKYIWIRVATTKTPVSGSASTSYAPSANGMYDSALTSALSTASSAQSSANSAASTVVTTKQYYLSTSSSSATGGSWQDSVPTWSSGKYIWVRFKIVKTQVSGTASTTYSPSENGVYDSTVTTALSTAYTANAGLTDKADKSAAVAETQRIYYRSSSSTKPNGNGLPTTWVTETGDKYNSNATTSTGWSRKVTPISNGTGSSVTKYLYLWTCIQKKTVSGTVTYGDILLDDSTTVIDGGKIITGSVAANSISATSGTFDVANIPDLTADKITAGTLNINRIPDGALNSNIEIGGRNLIRCSMPEISSGDTYWTNSTQREFVIEDGYPCIHFSGALQTTKSTTPTFTMYTGTTNHNIIPIPGQSFVFSADVKFVNVVKGTTNYLISLYGSGITVDGSWKPPIRKNDGKYYSSNSASDIMEPSILNGQGWTRVWIKYTYSDDVEWTAISPSIYTRDFTGDVYFKNIKFETGNVATDWTPAPEDVDREIKKGHVYIRGTQTAATGTWTGTTSELSSLEEGQVIYYFLPYNGSGSATLNLILADGTTTGAKNCYYSSTSRLTTHFTAGMTVPLIYHKALTIGSSTYEGWWAFSQYNSDCVDNRIVYFTGKTGAKGIWTNSIFMEDGNGTYQNICTASDGTVTKSNRTTATTKKANTNGFKVNGTLYYMGGTWSSSGTTYYGYDANSNINNSNVIYSSYGNLFDSRYSMNTTLTAGSLTTYVPWYLVGSIQNDLFYLDAVWWTQTPTTTGKVYILGGGVYDSTTSNCRITLYENNPWFVYDGSKLIPYEEYASKVATNFIAADATNGIMVYDGQNGTQTYSSVNTGNVVITSTGMKVRSGTNTLADYGTTITLGQETSGSLRTKIDSDTFWITNGTDDIAFIGNENKTITDTFVSDGSTLTYDLSSTWLSGGTFSPSSVTGSKVSGENKISVNSGTLPAAGQTFTYTYTPSSAVTYYTMGTRNSSTGIGDYSFAEGNNVTASGKYSHAEGFETRASGLYSHAEGARTTASSNYSHAEGAQTTASGFYSHAEGTRTAASGSYSHAEGYTTTAFSSSSHAEGYSTTASGDSSHAEGYRTSASNYAHSEGFETKARGLYSHTQNRGTETSRASQTVIGEYNTLDTIDTTVQRFPDFEGANNSLYYGEYVFIIGNGTGEENRSNAFTVDWFGNAVCYPETISLGAYVASGILTTSSKQIMFSIPTGRVLPSNASISKITFSVCARVANANGTGYFCIKKTSNGGDTVAFDSSATKTFYNASNTSKSLMSSMWTKSIQGGTNIYISWTGDADYFFSGSSTINNYVNNNPVVLYLSSIEVELNYS